MFSLYNVCNIQVTVHIFANECKTQMTAEEDSNVQIFGHKPKCDTNSNVT